MEHDLIFGRASNSGVWTTYAATNLIMRQSNLDRRCIFWYFLLFRGKRQIQANEINGV